MNLKVELYLHVPEERWSPEEIAKLSLGVADFVVEQGYGNVGAAETEKVKLTSVLIVSPVEEEITEKWWDKRAKGAMVVNFPTEDETFMRQADEGGIPGA